MAPKKKEQQKMSLGDFLTDGVVGGGSWADEVEETYGTQQLPPSDRPRYGGGSSWQDREYAPRDSGPQRLPDKPPYTAHLGNLSYDATPETVTDFFEGSEVVSVRIIEDREMQRPKGFGYVEFTTLDGLKQALTLDGQSFQNRMIKIKIADPPRGGADSGRGDSIRDLGNWTRTGPLPDAAPARGGRQPSEMGDRRPPRDPAAEPKPARDFTWERKGPLSPIAQPESAGDSRDGSRSRPAPEGLGERSESHRGSRRQQPATWGEGRQDGSRPPRREFAERPERPERPERTPTAAEKDMQWRDRMRPDQATKSPSGSTPTSPAPAAAVPAVAARPRLNLQKRTVSEATDAASPTVGDSKASPFGGARPIDTATRMKEVEEKRQQAIIEKREADEKAKEERRLAKEAAAKAQAEADAQAAAAEEKKAEAATNGKEGEAPHGEAEAITGTEEDQNGADAEQKVSIRTREPKDPAQNTKSRATEASSWRSASSEQRGSRDVTRGSRGGRGGARGGARHEGRPSRHNGPPSRSGQQQDASPSGEAESPAQDDDGWTTVPKKGRQGRPLA